MAAPARSSIRLAPPARADRDAAAYAPEAQNLKRGVAALCIGGGEATAIAIERVVRR